MPLQPVAHRQVIEFKATPSQQDGQDEHTGSHHDVGIERCVGMSPCPRHLHVHQGIVRDVERIGQLTQPSTDAGTFGVSDAAASPHRHDNRK